MRYLKENTQTALAQLATYLTMHNLTISCAESCTGGGLAYAFTSLPGSSIWFKHSVVTYSNEAKQTMVGVSDTTLKQYGAVSEQTVVEMAHGVVHQVGANIGISISGIAGPDGGSAEKPVGTVWFGFVLNGISHTRKMYFVGDREAVRLQAIEYAIEQIVELLPIRN